MELVRKLTKRFFCFLDFNHGSCVISFESGEGSNFRYVTRCHCGLREEKGQWKDDNQLMGYGKNHSEYEGGPY